MSKILFLDIETTPVVSYTWGTFQQNSLKILDFSKIISVSWKWQGGSVQVRAVSDYKGYKPGDIDDKKLVTEIWNLLDSADIVIGHHSDSFDIKKLNARFVFHGLNAPSPYKTVDTKKVAKKYFRFDSNSLNNLSEYFALGQKIDNGGFSLWLRCIAGDASAWKIMKKYNKQDVVLLEKLYLKLRPFINNHPNLNIIGGTTHQCPSCESHNVQKRGYSPTKTGKKQRYQCVDCGSWSSGPYERVKNVLAPIA